MKITNGNIITFFGIIHPLLAVSSSAFGKQFQHFSSNFFFNISKGIFEFPLLNGQMHYENFAAFWFFYFGVLLVPLGILLNHVEKSTCQIPNNFIFSYLVVVLIGVYMIPLSGMTFLMLPHALFMFLNRNSIANTFVSTKYEAN